jgi:thiol:disulfide interchange protein DsbD
VVLDFYADWCAPCKELDEKTFSDPRVAAALSGFARFKVDLTRSEPESEALRARYGVAGVPTIAFFAGGAEVTAARLTGFEPPPAFLQRLARVSPR